MAKRLSSLFSSKEDDASRSSTTPHFDASNNSPTGTPPRGKLTKPMSRPPSDYHLSGRPDADLPPPPIFTEVGMSSRSSSRDGRGAIRVDTTGSRASSSSRPQTPTMLGVPSTESPGREQSPNTARSKRKSWLPGKADRRSAGGDPEQPHVQAWIAGLRELVPYDITKLLNGEPVDDLWDDNGDVLVYLFPEASRKGPSFRVNSQLFADSAALSYLTQPNPSTGFQPLPAINLEPAGSMAALSLDDRFGGHSQPGGGQPQHFSRPMYGTSEQQTKTVQLPLNLEGDYSIPGAVPRGDDMELVVLYRNFFAFLCGGALIATHRQISLYAIFMAISSILKRLRYGNEKGSSWGTVPWASFSRYTDELRLADVRSSREKNIEAILIGVAMKSWPLYAEGFSHAVGRLEDIKSIKSPKFDRIDPSIINKLERAHHDLETNRLGPLHLKLDNFYFPSMFAGLANSQTSAESKLVSFKAWKIHFQDFRAYTMAQYKKRYGNWPPKASSKKNNFEESGLNRLLIREVYQDFTDLYELLVDRTSLTTRSADMPPIPEHAQGGSSETVQHVLRSVESEYDRSTPPVNPPIPFDVPQIPAFPQQMLAKDAMNSKKLKDRELEEILIHSYNRDSMKRTQWLQEFLDYERRLCSGKTVSEIADVRCGQWLFMYAVLQAMPMTVVDARDLQFTDGVEYFLCEAPKGGRPWMQEDDSSSRAWFNVASGGGLVSMPADVIDHSVEGIYRRSHCWTVANKWAEAFGPMSPVAPPSHAPAFQYPPAHPAPAPYLAPRNGSAAASPYASPLLQPVIPGVNDNVPALPKVSSRSSMHMGLEEVAAPVKSARPVSSYNPNITFDNILASQQISQKSGKKGKK